MMMTMGPQDFAEFTTLAFNEAKRKRVLGRKSWVRIASESHMEREEEGGWWKPFQRLKWILSSSTKISITKKLNKVFKGALELYLFLTTDLPFRAVRKTYRLMSCRYRKRKFTRERKLKSHRRLFGGWDWRQNQTKWRKKKECAMCREQEVGKK